MPIVGRHLKDDRGVKTPKSIDLVVTLTYERPGFLTRTVRSLRRTADVPVIIYDDGSTSQEKLDELSRLEADGFLVSREPHRGFIRSWVYIFHQLRESFLSPEAGVVLLEDDMIFSFGWDETLLQMAAGTEDLGLQPGAMTCFRVHEEPQAVVRSLRGVEAYQSMQHSFQINMVPAFVFDEVEFYEEAANNAEAGRHGIDVWFLGGLSHRLGLTNMVSVDSWVAHIGAKKSIVEGQGYQSFSSMGYGLSPELRREAWKTMEAMDE
jgi:hypothetical protein